MRLWINSTIVLFYSVCLCEVLSSNLCLLFAKCHPLGAPGIIDPCERKPTDATENMSAQEREDLTAAAQVHMYTMCSWSLCLYELICVCLCLCVLL